MTAFLQLVRFNPNALQNKKAVPLLLEFPVNPEMAPFLVTSTGAVQWVQDALPGDIIRSAVRRKTTKETVFLEIFEAVASMGVEAQWGNVHSFTEEGCVAAIDHIKSYDLTELEILVPPNRDAKSKLGGFEQPAWLTKVGLPVRVAPWLPNNSAIVLPQDRGFVGFVGLVGNAAGLVAVVHNASRGIGILRGV